MLVKNVSLCVLWSFLVCWFETGCLQVVKAISNFCSSWVSFPSTGTALWMAGTHPRKHCRELSIVLGKQDTSTLSIAHRMQLGDAANPKISFVDLQNGAMPLLHKGRELRKCRTEFPLRPQICSSLNSPCPSPFSLDALDRDS